MYAAGDVAASGHPALGVAWLAEQLAGRGQALGPGDLIITGGLTSAHPLEPGHRIGASFGDGQWMAEVRRPGAAPAPPPGAAGAGAA